VELADRPMETHLVAEGKTGKAATRVGVCIQSWPWSSRRCKWEKPSPTRRRSNHRIYNGSSVDSVTRGSATAPPTSARRESAVFDASHSTLPTPGADFQTRYAATHTNQTNRKQSTPGPFQPARAGIVQTKVRQTEIGVDTVVPSTHLQSAV